LNDDQSSEEFNMDYMTKIKLLELLLNDLKRKNEILASYPLFDNSNYKKKRTIFTKKGLKRNFLRAAVKEGDRRRPGWELAYGKRKRSVAVSSDAKSFR
jgi:hypothetical protein